MAPKKQEQVSKKSVQKEAKQIIEDQTFGLKNKNKSKKVQQYVQSIEKNVQNKVQAVLNKDKPQQSASDIQKAIKEEERKQQQLALLRQTLKQPKVADGEDPKTIMCIFFQYGCCEKGDKCKFSHGIKERVFTEQEVMEQKLQKEVEKEAQRQRELGFTTDDMGSLNVNRDMRDQILEFRAKQTATKSGRAYDEVLLELQEREKEKSKNQNYSTTICDHFIQACRDGIVGFGWICPNEKTQGYCQYRHWIPVDFELFKKEELDMDLDYEELEDKIERQREEIVQGTPVTAETFAIWKAARLQRQKEEKENEELKREKEGTWSGRQIFERGLYRKDAENEDEGNQDDFMNKWKEQQAQRKADELRIEQIEQERLQKEYDSVKDKEE